MKFWDIYRKQCAIDNELSAYLLTCTPFKAKAHLKQIDAMFVRFNAYVAKPQQIRISLKVPTK